MTAQAKIHRLKETIINRIAAGEVVERPASAVKELVENAIDSGADRIEIATAGGGKNLIRVSDNGCGIAESELELAVSRHCTSKMDEDIHDIRALGFRGEALPSIASVAHLRLASRVAGAGTGAEICVSGGHIEPVRPAALNGGTVAEVRDLFYATPARLKFLKSDKAEAAAITDTVKRIAIAFPHIRFTLSGSDRALTDLPAAPLFTEKNDKTDAYAMRISQILGREFMENSAPLTAEREGVRLSGFVSIPSYNRGNAQHQFFYVNGRPVRDKNLSGALRAAYMDMLPASRHAVAALFLELNPALVDVNVHPAKADVRFRDAGLVRGLIIGAIRQTLEQSGARPSTAGAAAFMRIARDNAADAARNEPRFPAASASYNAAAKPIISRLTPPADDFMRADFKNGFDEDDAEIHATEQDFRQSQMSSYSSAPTAGEAFAPSANASSAEEEAASEGDEAENFPLGAARAQIHKNYIIAQTEDSLIIVDQHAAHERLVYEALKQALYAKPLAAQMLLIPEIVELPPEDIARLTAHAEFLARFGLELEAFGGHAVAVRSTPAMLGQVDIAGLIRDLADEAAENNTADGLKKRLDYIAATMACHGSVRSGRLLKPQEMNALLRQMEQVPQSGTCNHGRPTFIELKLSDIEKLFSRR